MPRPTRQYAKRASLRFAAAEDQPDRGAVEAEVAPDHVLHVAAIADVDELCVFVE
jgi:hypothetical protein